MLESFVDDVTVPEARPVGPISGPAIIGLSTFAPSGEHIGDLPSEITALVNDGEVVGWWVPPGDEWSPRTSTKTTVEIHGISLVGAWDILTATEDFLKADTADFARHPSDEIPDGSIVIGDPSDVVILGSRVEPNVVFDTHDGPIVLQSNSYVKGGTRFEGPVYVGPDTQILGGLIKNSAIGPMCKLHGEIQSSYLPPYSWGVGGERMTKEGFLATAERVLPRRKIEFTDTVRQSLSALYDHATA
jgi:hypothetical protein